MVNALLYGISVLVWGTTWYAIKLQLGIVPIEWSLIYRFVLATALLFAFCAVSGRNLRFSAKEHRVFLGLGLFMFSTNYYFSYLGVSYVTSGLVAVMFSTLSIMNIVNAAVFLRKPLDPTVLIAALIGFSGIALIFWPEIARQHWTGAETLTGVGIILLGAYSASLGNTIVATNRARTVPLIQLNAWGMLYGVILLIAFTLLSGIQPAYDTSLTYNLSLVYLALFGTIVAFLSFLALISRIGSERAGYTAIGWPVVALVISTFFEGFDWTLQAAMGVLMVLAGNLMILGQRPRLPKPALEN